MLRLEAANVRVGGHAFGPFDLQAAAGERIAILGPSGAGKSTLLKLASGEHVAASGTVWLHGERVSHCTPSVLALRRAVLPQSTAVAFGLPVTLVVSLGRIARRSDPEQRAIVDQALRAAQAEHLHERRYDTLSGGEQARVQLARVFAQLWDVRDGLLLVDEPLAALDPGLSLDLMAALQRYAAERRHALVAVLHDINQALACFDRLWLVKHGRLVADLPAGPDAYPALERLYGIRLKRLADADGHVAVLALPRAAEAANTG